MVLVIIGILCLYYYCGRVAASMDRDRNGNEKRSLHTPRLAVIFWERQETSIALGNRIHVL